MRTYDVRGRSVDDMTKPWSELSGCEEPEVREARCGTPRTSFSSQCDFFSDENIKPDWEFVERMNKSGVWFTESGYISLHTSGTAGGFRQVRIPMDTVKILTTPGAELDDLEVIIIQMKIAGDL